MAGVVRPQITRGPTPSGVVAVELEPPCRFSATGRRRSGGGRDTARARTDQRLPSVGDRWASGRRWHPGTPEYVVNDRARRGPGRPGVITGLRKLVSDDAGPPRPPPPPGTGGQAQPPSPPPSSRSELGGRRRWRHGGPLWLHAKPGGHLLPRPAGVPNDDGQELDHRHKTTVV